MRGSVCLLFVEPSVRDAKGVRQDGREGEGEFGFGETSGGGEVGLVRGVGAKGRGCAGPREGSRVQADLIDRLGRSRGVRRRGGSEMSTDARDEAGR
jgi:hypothetical protein